MDIGRAISYVFDDEKWGEKLAILGLLMLFSPLILPFMVALGYMVRIVYNVRNGNPRPLPAWDDYGGYLAAGANVLMAVFIYNLPFAVLNSCIIFFASSMDGNFFISSFAFISVCCLLPLTLLYALLIWPILALGVVRYSETGKSASFYQTGRLFQRMRDNAGATLQWALASFLTSLGIGLLSLIPCCGWLIVLTLTMPIQAHLIGQYGINTGRKMKQKRA